MSDGDIVFVRVQLVSGEYEWRTVVAATLLDAMELAEDMPDVDLCLEASWLAGGVAT